VWDMAWTTKDPGKGVDHGTPQGGTSS
jgi:hypothetical protein